MEDGRPKTGCGLCYIVNYRYLQHSYEWLKCFRLFINSVLRNLRIIRNLHVLSIRYPIFRLRSSDFGLPPKSVYPLCYFINLATATSKRMNKNAKIKNNCHKGFPSENSLSSMLRSSVSASIIVARLSSFSVINFCSSSSV